MANTIVFEAISRKYQKAILEKYEKEDQSGTLTTMERKAFYPLFMEMDLEEMVPKIDRKSSSFSEWNRLGDEYKLKLPEVFTKDFKSALEGLEMASREITKATG